MTAASEQKSTPREETSTEPRSHLRYEALLQAIWARSRLLSAIDAWTSHTDEQILDDISTVLDRLWGAYRMLDWPTGSEGPTSYLNRFSPASSEAPPTSH